MKARTISGRIPALSCFALAVAVAACGKEPEKAAAPPPEPAVLLTEVGFAELPGWREDRVGAALPALRLSCGSFLKQPDERPVGPEAMGGQVADWRAPCEAVAALPDGDDAAARALLERWFRPFRVAAPDSDLGLFTGYYEAELRGSLKRDERFRWPLYRRPGDLISVDLGRFRADLAGERILGRVRGAQLVPYFPRAEIDQGILAGRDLELLWADDPVDVFFLHVQGSGQVLLPDGRRMRVGFAASNGLPFYAIGRALIQEGQIPRGQMSMQGIRDWLRANPEKASEVMSRNARYIFFREIDGAGPVGAQGLPLTAGRSLAIDSALLPLGVPVWLDTTWPASERPLQRLMVAQDVGGAIKGAVRGDVYWGSGEAALAQAGKMKQQGRYYIFLPETVAERRRTTS